MLSEADRLQLDAFRIRRFEELFAGYLANSTLMVQYQQLVIVLPNQDAAIALLTDPDMLLWFAGLVLAVKTVEVHIDNNCIWSGCTRNDSALNWEEAKQGSSPMPATLEAPTVTAVQVNPIPTADLAPLSFQRLTLLGDVVEQLAQMTGRDGQGLLEEIKATGIPIFAFSGQLLIDADSTDQVIDRWAASLKARLRDFPAMDTNRNGAASANGNAIAPAKSTRSAAKAKSKPPGKSTPAKPSTRAKSKTTPKGTARKTAS